MEATLHNYDTYTKAVSLITSFTNIETGRVYKYYSPLLKGYLRPIITVDTTIPNGHYALTNMVHPAFLAISGKVENWKPSVKSLVYIVKAAKEKTMDYNSVTPDSAGRFNLGKMLVMNDASITFLTADKKVNKKLNVILTNNLDSAFYPIDSVTTFIRVTPNPKTDVLDTGLINNYIRAINNKSNYNTTESIIVQSKLLSPMALYKKTFVHSPFDGADAIVMDGLDKDELVKAVNIMSAIEFSTPGFKVVMNGDIFSDENAVLSYRGIKPIYYVDEMEETLFPWYLSTDDVALVKIFTRGIVALGGSADGTNRPIIAIYTKQDLKGKKPTNRTSFKIKGYKNYRYSWK